MRKVVRTKTATPSAKGLLLQGVCDVLTTRAWMWDHGIAKDRRCPCGQEGTPDHWIKGCGFSAKSTGIDTSSTYGTWKEFRQALVYKARPRCEVGPVDYECWAQGEKIHGPKASTQPLHVSCVCHGQRCAGGRSFSKGQGVL